MTCHHLGADVVHSGDDVAHLGDDMAHLGDDMALYCILPIWVRMIHLVSNSKHDGSM